LRTKRALSALASSYPVNEAPGIAYRERKSATPLASAHGLPLDAGVRAIAINEDGLF